MLRPWRVSLLLAIFFTAALGNWNDTSTGIDLDKLRHFPVSKIRSGLITNSSRVTFAGITATASSVDGRDVRLQGKGKWGKRWEVHISNLDEVWRADLDANGTLDYVFFGDGPYFNGRTTPLYSLSILLMDQEGMPVPFFTVVYKGANGNGIKHLVDLDHDGKAELIISSYDEENSDPHVGYFCSGHWVNQIMQFWNYGAEEVRGRIAGRTFPVIHNWTYGEKKCGPSETPNPVRPPRIFEQGTSKNGAKVTKLLKKVDIHGLFAINPVEGCQTVRPKVVVYDREQLREIAFPNLFHDHVSELANQIQRDGVSVELRGLHQRIEPRNCLVNLLWAEKHSSF